MLKRKFAALFALLALVAMPLAACSDDTAEETGEALESAGDDVEDAMDEMAE